MLGILWYVVLSASAAQAQVVRGLVRESSTGTPIEGALVSLESAVGVGPSGTVNVLSDERGEFAIRAANAGEYRLSAKRIGVKRTLTEPFQLGAGETRQITIDLEPVLYVLPEVAVATANFCIPKRDQVGRVAALWEEVRTALTATSISVRDSLYRGRIVSYARLLDGRGRVLSETTRHHDGVLNGTFSAVHPETVSVNGYWREEQDSVRFDAPDVDILLSGSFLRDHCFELGGEAPDEIALRFSPAPGRPVTDVMGTMWVDARTFELRRLEFTWTRLPRVERVQNLGGEVHFARLASGAWVVRRWSLRVPQFAQVGFVRRWGTRADPSLVRGLGIDRLVENRVRENGGMAFIDHLRSFESPSSLRGMVRDSAGAPLSAALVRLAGTRYAVRADSNGRFAFDSVPPGLYQVEAITDSLSALDVALAAQEVTVSAGADASVNLRGTGIDGLLARMCGGRSLTRDRTAMRVMLVADTANRPAPATPLRLWWTEYVRERGVNRVVRQQLDAETAGDGSVVFCGLPVNVPLDLGPAIGADRAHRLETVVLPSRHPIVRIVSMRPS